MPHMVQQLSSAPCGGKAHGVGVHRRCAAGPEADLLDISEEPDRVEPVAVALQDNLDLQRGREVGQRERLGVLAHLHLRDTRRTDPPDQQCTEGKSCTACG